MSDEELNKYFDAFTELLDVLKPHNALLKEADRRTITKACRQDGLTPAKAVLFVKDLLYIVNLTVTRSDALATRERRGENLRKAKAVFSQLENLSLDQLKNFSGFAQNHFYSKIKERREMLAALVPDKALRQELQRLFIQQEEAAFSIFADPGLFRDYSASLDERIKQTATKRGGQAVDFRTELLERFLVLWKRHGLKPSYARRSYCVQAAVIFQRLCGEEISAEATKDWLKKFV